MKKIDTDSIKELQGIILQVMKYIDQICRENGITYYIMGGTALGAVRHNGFIPWDDDLDIFMTPSEYQKFIHAFNNKSTNLFSLTEYLYGDNYLDFAKVRMNGTKLIEKNFIRNGNEQQGIFVDIMMLHKCPRNRLIQKILFFESKFVRRLILAKRGFISQKRIKNIVMRMIKDLPLDFLFNLFFSHIYKYETLETNFQYCYFRTPVKFKQGLFDEDFFDKPIDVRFEDTCLMASAKIKEYLKLRYGDYMELPPEEKRTTSQHAEYFETTKMD